MNKMAEFQLSDDEVIVNGLDVTASVTAARYTHVANETPRLELELTGSADVIKGEGIVYVSQPTPNEILRFLDSVEPGKLNDMVLERMGWGNDHVGELTVEVLREMANAYHQA